MQYFKLHGLDITALSSAPLGDWPASGRVSPDNVAITCKSGWLDMFMGSNRYLESYIIDAESAKDIASAWSNYLSYWKGYFNGRNIEFLALVVPNKATVIAENYPISLPLGMTPMLKSLIELQGKNLYVPVNEMRDLEIRDHLFRRNDSHLAEPGNYFLAEGIAGQLGYDATMVPPPGQPLEVTQIGDLGNKFDPPLAERFVELRPSGPAAEIVSQSVDAEGRSSGMQWESLSNTAQIDKRVLLFGNSYVDAPVSWAMGPILSKMFRSLRFRWTSEIDATEVDGFKPEIVIFQTCERFLRRPPPVIE